MRVVPSVTAEELEPLLTTQAEQLFGTDRAQELSNRISELSRTLAHIASRDLPMRGVPPDTSGITDRGRI